MAGAWPSSAAHINAVVPRKVSFAFTSAPWSSSTLIASTLPVRDATIRGVLPSGRCSLASAPALSSAAMIAASPLMLASHNGVAPSRFAALGFAPARSNRSTIALIGPENRPVQRGGAIGLRCVHIGVLLHQLLDRRQVPAHHRVRNVGGSGGAQNDRRTGTTEARDSFRRVRFIDSVYRFVNPARAVADAVLVNVVLVQHAQ